MNVVNAVGRREKRILIITKSGMILGLITLLAGVMVLVGWIFDVPTLKSITPNLVSMKANTAIGFILFGLSLLLLKYNDFKPIKYLSIIFASTLFTIGILTLIQYLLSIDFGIDQLFFKEPAGTIGTLSPGRMAPATAINFILLGITIILTIRRKIVISQRIALITGIIGLIPLLGYFYNIKEFIGISYYTQLAIHTAILFIACSLSILFANPTEGIMQHITNNTMGGWLLRRTVVFVIIIPILLGWLRITGEQSGYFNSEIGVALMMISIIIILSAMFWWAAKELTRMNIISNYAEQKVNESESQIRATLYGIGDGIIATDNNGCITRMNPMAEKLTGWKESESIGLNLDNIYKIIDEDTREQLENPLKEVLNNGIIAGLSRNILLISRNGTEKPIADSAAPIYNTDGETIGVVLVVRDQSVIRKAQAIMREREVFSKSVLDAVGASIAVIDKNGVIIAVNKAWQEFAIANNDNSNGTATGVGINYLEITRNANGEYVEGSAEAYEGICNIIAGNITEFSIEYPCHSENVKRWFLLRATPLAGDKGGAVLAHIDITERKISEIVQHETEELYRLLFENSGEAILFTRPDGVIYSANPQACKMLGRSEEEICRIGFSGIIDINDNINLQNQEINIIFNDELKMIKSDGSIFPAEISTAFFIDSNGNKNISLIARDISERKHSENALRKSEAEYRSLFENSLMGISVVNKDGKLMQANAAYAEMYGYESPEEMMNEIQSVGTLYANPNDRTEILHLLHEYGFLEPREVEVIHRTGKHFFVLVSAQGTKDDDGNLLYNQAIHINITAKKAAEDALRESEVHFRTLADFGQALIWTSGLDMKCNYFNQPWLEFTGRTLEQEVGDGWVEGVHPDDLEKCVNIYVNSFKKREKFSMDYRIRHHDGFYRWIQDNGTPRYDSQNNFIGYIGHCLDITDRKQYEEEIARNNETQNVINRLLIMSMENMTQKDFLDSTLDLVLSLKWLDFEQKGAIFIASENDNTLSMISSRNFSPEMITTCNELNFGKCLCGKAAKTKEIQFADHISLQHEIEYNEMLPHGHYCVPLISGERISGVLNLYVSDGHISSTWEIESLKAIANTIAGTIEHKRAEEELIRINNLLDSIIENVPNTIFLKNARDLRYVLFNNAGEKSWGYSRYQIIGQTNNDIFPTKQAEIFNNNDMMILNTKSVLEIPELQVLNKDNEERVLHTWLVPINNKNGDVEYILGITEDITNWKNAANERVALEEQLRQQQRLESIGQLAAGVAHDFNNLLTGIKGFTQFAYDSVPDGSSIRSDLGEVLSLAKRAAELTRQLLAFSRRQTLQPVVININDLIGNLIKMLGRLIGEKIDLKFIPGTENNAVKADPGQIEQVLVNLAINARDAMPDGGKLTIETSDVYIDKEYAASQTGTQPGSYVMISITDNGCGMNETVVKHLFEPFFTTKGIGKGTGLGLATVYGIIKQHGGNIWAYSEENIGTTFKIYLPQVNDEININTVNDKNEVIKGTETILIVEDEATVRDVAKRILETQGYTVLTASLPSEALSILDEHGDKIALLLTDIVMPEQNGTQLYESVHEKYPRLRVLYMSGYPEKNSIRDNLISQKVPFIQKPFKFDSLGIKVREVLNDKQ